MQQRENYASLRGDRFPSVVIPEFLTRSLLPPLFSSGVPPGRPSAIGRARGCSGARAPRPAWTRVPFPTRTHERGAERGPYRGTGGKAAPRGGSARARQQRALRRARARRSGEAPRCSMAATCGGKSGSRHAPAGPALGHGGFGRPEPPAGPQPAPAPGPAPAPHPPPPSRPRTRAPQAPPAAARPWRGSCRPRTGESWHPPPPPRPPQGHPRPGVRGGQRRPGLSDLRKKIHLWVFKR